MNSSSSCLDSIWTRPHEVLTSSSRQNSRRPRWPVAPSFVFFVVVLFAGLRYRHYRHSATSPLSIFSRPLRAVRMFCHILLTPPFTSTLDAPSGLPWWDVFVPPLPFARCPQYSSSWSPSRLFRLFPHDALHEQPWCAALVLSVGALVASPACGTRDSS